ncbi:Mor transcription activator family protein [Aggregatibacter actinomycetemcomitans]|uniref:Mor transcription activator family protein n=1 Tax=Aggregatibacter actinomycetemcomitans TaxID=714 RepID=UPI000D69D889|nr:Mor transcription activator family protein [Aggregatibacter actinomycetemcomitans]
MSNNQDDLFADDHEMLGQLFDKLDNIPDDELSKAWNSVLAELIAVIKAEIKRQDLAVENKMIEKIVIAISHYMGGRAIYLPNGDRIKAALRDYAIYEDFNGKNMKQLSERYGLSEPHIYDIIRKQRKLIRRRHQPELPY